jgi:MHS family proline/betaine transporter-like MFS transporter
MNAAHRPEHARASAAMRRGIAATAIGNLIERFDFGVYSYLATTIAHVFYPHDRAGGVGLIVAFGTMAAAFVVRPLGGLVFGPLGDRIGRKPVLIVTILLLAAATTTTGLLPGYAALGAWAPLLLVVVRIVQGLSTGGEYVGGMTYISEQAPDHRRGQLAAFLPLGSWSGYVCGAALVTGLQSVLTTQQMLSWGWRIPFLLCAPLGLVTLYLRRRLGESADYVDIDESQHVSGDSGKQQFKRTVLGQWRPLLICIGLALTFNVTASMLAGYLPTYLTHVVGIGDAGALVLLLAVLAVVASAVVFVAKLADRIGVKPIMWAGCTGLLVASVPAFWLIRFGGSYPVMFIGVASVGMMLLCFASTEPSVLPALFSTNVRYGALAIGFNVSVSAFGGTTPLVAQTLISATGEAMIPAFLLVAAGVVGVVTLLFTPEVAGRPVVDAPASRAD